MAASTDPGRPLSRTSSSRPHQVSHDASSESQSTASTASKTASSPSSKSQHEAQAALATLTRSVSEIRDGMVNQRELEEAVAGEKGDAPAGEPQDPDLVTWEGPDDPENPKNWHIRQKWAAVVTVSLFTVISPISSSMIAPGLPAVGATLDIASPFELNLTLSIFVAAYALGPLLWGPLSELHGRVLILQVSNLWFLCFNLGCALAHTETTMIVMRFLSGIGGSAPLAVGGGVLSDLFAPEQRGRAISVYSVAPLLGPALGPVAGGFIAETTSWRWCFFSTTIACGAVQLAALYFLHETYAPTILAKRRRRLLKSTGNERLRTEHDRPDRSLARTLGAALTRPFRLLLTQPVLVFLSLYMMYLYGTIYLLITTFPTLFGDVYRESPAMQGLDYISLGVGFFLGAQICAPLQDRIYARLKRRCLPAPDRPGRPEFRVPLMLPAALLVPVGLLLFGWTAEREGHWILPNIGAAVTGAGIIIAYQCIQAYLVDSYPRHAASAVAAATVLRSLAGFGFPLFAPAMWSALGYGVGGTVLAGISVVLGFPGPFLLWRFGAEMRAKSKYAT